MDTLEEELTGISKQLKKRVAVLKPGPGYQCKAWKCAVQSLHCTFLLVKAVKSECLLTEENY